MEGWESAESKGRAETLYRFIGALHRLHFGMARRISDESGVVEAAKGRYTTSLFAADGSGPEVSRISRSQSHLFILT